MYKPFHQEEVVSFKFPWEPNTAKGFFYSCLIAILFMILFAIFQISPNDVIYDRENSSIPIELLNFGDGDGTGISKGNLSREGAAFKGNSPQMSLESASKAAANVKAPLANDQDPMQSTNIIAVNKFSSDQNKSKAALGNDAKNVGTPNGSPNGFGMGTNGTGPGLGWGLGNIDWGGGGNRRPSKDKLPMPIYRPGADVHHLEIKVDILVDRDGITRILRFSQKGNPELENAIEKALKQWTFNKIDRDVVQKGTVTFIFKAN